MNAFNGRADEQKMDDEAQEWAAYQAVVTEMSRDELVEAIYNAYDGADHKQFKFDTMAAIGEWLEYGAPVTEDDTVESLAADWAEYNETDEE